MDLRKICFLLFIIFCTTRQFVDRDIIGNRDLDSETYQNSFKRILTEQTPNTNISRDKSKDNKQKQILSQTQTNKQIKQDHKTQQKSQFDSVDYAGDISSSLNSLLSPNSGIDQDLLNKILQNTGITDKQQLNQQYQAQKIEQNAAEEQKKQFEDKLSDWVKKEKEESDITLKKVQKQQIILEGFSFSLKPQQFKKLYMKVPRGKPQNYLFHIDIYWKIEGNYIVPRTPTESQVLNLTISHNNKPVHSTTTYVSRFFEWYQYLQNGNIQLKFDNHIGQDIVVLVNVERLKTVADSIKQQKIDPLVEKLKKVIDDTNSKSMMKIFHSIAQSGFRDNEQSMISSLLLFSGIQSITILVVMMIQLYYLQRLISNNNVMV